MIKVSMTLLGDEIMQALEKNMTGVFNENRIVDKIRALGIDMIKKAGSGHPGIVLGAAPIIYTIYAHHLRFDPKHPNFFNRDRFVLSGGHGSALLYATLAMAGYDLELEDLEAFRQLGSKTPGHPEYGKTPGVEMTTGPLGQGFASAVGMAIAEKHTEALFKEKKSDLIHYQIYCLCGDGDLMEGVSYETASLAGTLKLNNLIVLYDSNHVCLDGDTISTFNDDIIKRFEAMGWEVQSIGDDIDAINKAIAKAKLSEKPNLIEVKTTIGKYAKDAGKNTIHGRKLDDEDVTLIKQSMNMRDIPFTITNEALNDFQGIIETRNGSLYVDYLNQVEQLNEEAKKLLEELTNDHKKIDLLALDYEPSEEAQESVRLASSKMLNSYAKSSELIIGGSADLASSTLTYLHDMGDFSSSNYEGRNIIFGVREFASAAIANGLALSGYRPFVSTYLSFSDYMRPAIRLSALMNLPVVYIFTHDSITVGMDGPTHQPVEQLVGLRAMPNLSVFRPADSNEVIGTFRSVYESNMPSAIVLSRNTLPIIETTSVPLVQKGAYIIREEERKLDGIIIATGEEVSLALEVSKTLMEKGYDLRVVSMPNIGLFLKQESEYQEEILPAGTRKFVIERSSSYSWYRFVYNDQSLFTVDQFGESAPSKDLDEKYGFTKEIISLKIEQQLK